VAAAETTGAPQRDPRRRLAANESPQRCGSYGRLGAVGLPRVDFCTPNEASRAQWAVGLLASTELTIM
jgi:hypothetical protein